jgi:inositol-phosphate phosphatase/L-galactose 1-phosphate phosphatase/histidinol-phosphatase
MSFTCPPEFLALAHELADAARPVALKYFRVAGLAIEQKADRTPVTIADKEIEAILTDMIRARFPEHGIFGEEQGHLNKDAEFTWILDPIDGTKSFTVGRPNFGTLIALWHRDHGAVLGLCDMPAIGDRWYSLCGEAVYMNGKPVKTRGTKTIEESIFTSTDPLRLPAFVLKKVQSIREKVRIAIYGGDCLNYALLASGFLDVIVDNRQQLYDIAPFVPIIHNAGGKITQIDGRPIGFDNGDMIVAASTPELHARILDFFKETI